MQDPKFIDVGGIQTRYFEAGQGEPVVLVHGGQFGWFNCATDWDLNFDDLARDFHVFALDRIGQGHSDNPRDPSEYLLGTASQHLYDFIKAVGLTQAHLVGHSRGGYGVTRVALEHPEVVKSLVIVDSGSLMHQSAPFYDELDKKAAHITDTREMIEFKMVNSSFSGDIMSQGWVDDIMTFIETPKHRIAQETNAETKTVSRADHIQRQSESQEAIRNGALKNFPVLVIWAYDDQSASMEECGIPAMHLILPNVPNSRMHVFNQAGHYVFREHPKEFNAIVRTFLNGL
ncbi:MAG: Pimeloyl-ACP methyl ester carboxylesterase [Chloroflexi bacterium]|jgi:pimeloyl-ACP methyl ester carboxylesterase|nr:MAG: Pimeloyl-ACP methyl ester carboxylesterase [Chloroflexota bacterium]